MILRLNATELLDWQELWCFRCEHDHDLSHVPDGDDGCPLLLAQVLDDDVPEFEARDEKWWAYIPAEVSCSKFQACSRCAPDGPETERRGGETRREFHDRLRRRNARQAGRGGRVTRAAQYSIALGLVLLAIFASWPNHEETALRTRNVVSSVPARHRIASEYSPPERTTLPRASRNAVSPHVTNAPAPKQRVVPRPAVQPIGSIQEAICNVFRNACQWALRVAKCESGYNPRATNGQFRGLLQVGVRIHAARIARMGFTPEQMWEVGPNLAVASAIYSESGPRAWQCK